MQIKDVKNVFKVKGEYINYEVCEIGHINDTYILSFLENGKTVKYILQKMNTNVFKNPEYLMSNVQKVTKFLKKTILAQGGDPSRECLNLIDTVEGNAYFKDADGYWRMYLFIDNASSHQIAEDAEMFADAGNAFGKFISLLNDFPAEELFEVIADFHNTQKRLEMFEKALKADKVNRASGVTEQIEFVLQRKNYCSKVVDILGKELPLRVTHNDTKLNNIMIDDQTNKSICVIDLDTIMPGSLLYDFGDAIRSGCNTGLEDEQDLTKVDFDINLFESFAKGFLQGLGKNITPKEVELLAFSAILMTYECGMRFLTDYLDGDNYFRVHYATHNLVRAKTQFKLVLRMEQQLDKMNEIVRKYVK
ncbi:MAG: aminoglycoside phosphotransferase family protein [Clostridia bacterium]